MLLLALSLVWGDFLCQPLTMSFCGYVIFIRIWLHFRLVGQRVQQERVSERKRVFSILVKDNVPSNCSHSRRAVSVCWTIYFNLSLSHISAALPRPPDSNNISKFQNKFRFRACYSAINNAETKCGSNLIRFRPIAKWKMCVHNGN